MVNNGNNRNCGFDDVMVSYIYDEVKSGERRKFEAHLVDCSECTEEFAEISGARFSVFEWQKEAFAELPTPEIVIPYAKARKVEPAQIGFFAALRGLFGGYGFSLTAAAALLICLGIGFAALTLMRGDDLVATNTVVDAPNVLQTTVVDRPSVNDSRAVIGIADTVVSDVVKENIPTEREIKPLKAAVESRRLRPGKQMTAENVVRNKRVSPQVRRAPALSNFDEVDDKSLRLTDLFDGIGTIR